MSDSQSAPRDAEENTTGDTPNGVPPAPPQPSHEPWAQRFIRELSRGTALITILSVVLALFVGGILIAIANSEVQDAASYFFSRPADTLSAAWDAVSDAYAALFRGSIIDFSDYTIGRALRPLGETLAQAAPLIAAGLGVALAFRAGLFNIGAEGQILAAAILAG